MTRVIATVIAAMVFVLSGGSALAENLQDPGHQDQPGQCWQQTENGPVLGPCPQEEDEDEDQQVLHCAHYDENGKLVIGECAGDGDGDGDDEEDEEEPEDNSGTYNPTHHNPDVRVANPTFTG